MVEGGENKRKRNEIIIYTIEKERTNIGSSFREIAGFGEVYVRGHFLRLENFSFFLFLFLLFLWLSNYCLLLRISQMGCCNLFSRYAHVLHETVKLKVQVCKLEWNRKNYSIKWTKSNNIRFVLFHFIFYDPTDLYRILMRLLETYQQNTHVAFLFFLPCLFPVSTIAVSYAICCISRMKLIR